MRLEPAYPFLYNRKIRDFPRHTYMSKLLDRLDRITRGPVRTLGFAPASVKETVPTLALLAEVAAARTKEAHEALTSGADAVILSLTGKTHKLPEMPEGSSCGAEVQSLDKAQADTLRTQGYDFLVFGIEGTQAEALEEGDCTRILRVSSALEDTQLRCIEDLPVDVVIVTKPAPEGPLSLTHLLAISNVRAATSRYVLLEWDADLSGKELEQLRDMGVDGIVFKADGDAPAATVASLHERIAALPARRPRSDKDGRSPILPRLELGGPGRQRSEPEPDEEEEEDY